MINNITKKTSTVTPKLGFIGFFGLAGFLGIWTYRVNGEAFPFVFFSFFGFFGFFFEGKLSTVLKDEHFIENRIKAKLKAYRVSATIVIVTLIVSTMEWLFPSDSVKLVVIYIMLSLSWAIFLILSEYLLYRHYKIKILQK